MAISAERQTILDWARSFLGVSWKHQGRSRAAGIDCVGLPLLVGIEMGYMEESLRAANYPKRPNNTLIPLFHEYLEFVRPGDRKPGDIMVFADSGHPCHCGFLGHRGGLDTVIHAHAHDRQVVEEPMTAAIQYLGKPVYTFKFKGLD